MKSRKLLTSGILILATSLSLLISGVALVNATQPNFDPDLEIFYQDNSKIYKSRGFATNVEIAQLEGAISSEGGKVASNVKARNSRQPDQFVYILDISSGSVLNQIPINSSLDLIALNWSPDDRYITLRETAQYVGGLTLHIVDYEKKQEIDSFPILNDDVIWISSTEFLFFDPYSECSNRFSNTTKCRDLSPAISIYNVQDGKSKMLKGLSKGEETFQDVIYRELRDGRIIYQVRSYNKSNGITDLDNWSDDYYSFNLKTGGLQNLSREDLLIEQVSNVLPTLCVDLSIQKITQNNTKTDSYLVQLSSLKDDQRHYVGVFNTSTGEFDLRGRGIFSRWKVNR